MDKMQSFEEIDDVKRIDYIDDEGYVKFVNISKFPFITLPNGNPCNIANKYFIKKSFKLKPSTLRQYASQLGSLIRYVYDQGIDFLDMNSDKFVELYVNEREREKEIVVNSTEDEDEDEDEGDGEDEGEDKVIRMTKNIESRYLNAKATVWIDFLVFVGEEHNDSGSLLRAINVSKSKKEVSRNGRITIETVWSHDCFDEVSPEKKRDAISDNSINALYSSIKKVTDDKFLIRRKEALIRVLESTGARISEISELQVDDIRKASKMKKPMLRLITSKSNSGYRLVPVLHQDLRVLLKFIDVQRKIKISKTIGSANDHGYIFISEKTGKQLTSKYMSDEVGSLRRASGISDRACAHMFRHRFITKLFIGLCNEYNSTDRSQLYSILKDKNTFKKKIQQYTGHRSIGSVDHYIDLAIDEIQEIEKLESGLRMRNSIEVFDREVNRLSKQLKEGMNIEDYLSELEDLYRKRDLDLDN